MTIEIGANAGARSTPGRASAAGRRDALWRDPGVAGRYLDGIRGAIPDAAAQIDVVLRLAAALGRPVRRVLDLGAGDGVLAAALLGRFPDAAATLVDFSPPMLAAAAARFAAREPPVRLVAADLGDPGWRAALGGGAVFDIAVSGFAIHHLADGRKRELYGEVFALLAPGGLFANVEHVASPSAWLEGVSDEQMIDALAAYDAAAGAARGRQAVAAAYHARPDKAANLLAPVETQCAWLREIDFVDVDCFWKRFELAVFGGRRPEE